MPCAQLPPEPERLLHRGAERAQTLRASPGRASQWAGCPWARAGTFLWPWERKGAEGSNSGGRRGAGRTRLCLHQLLSRPKQLWAQVLDCPRQVSPVPAATLRQAVRTADGTEKTETCSPWHIRVMVETGAAWGQGSQQQLGPGPDLRILQPGEKLNGGQSVAGGWGEREDRTSNSGCKQTHAPHQAAFTKQCSLLSVFKHVPQGVELQQRHELGHPRPPPQETRSWVGLSCSRDHLSLHKVVAAACTPSNPP